MKFIISLALCFIVIQSVGQLGQVISQMRNVQSTITSDAVYKKGKSFAQVGIGFPNLFFVASDLSATATSLYSTQKKGFVNFVANYEYAIKPNIGIGVIFGYSAGEYRYVSKTNPANYFGYKGSFVNIGVLSNYHIYSNKNVDFYTGAMLVYNAKNIKDNSSGNTSITIPFIGTISVFQLISAPKASDLLYQVSLGLRAFPFKQKNIGFFAEAGYGITVLKLGVASSF
jgi:hypothetical protein